MIHAFCLAFLNYLRYSRAFDTQRAMTLPLYLLANYILSKCRRLLIAPALPPPWFGVGPVGMDARILVGGVLPPPLELANLFSPPPPLFEGGVRLGAGVVGMGAGTETVG